MEYVPTWAGAKSKRRMTDISFEVDDDDYERVMQHRWTLIKPTPGGAAGIYAKAKINGINVPLHRFIINAPAGMLVDHIDRNTLNCRKSNLRLCTKAENSWNRTKSRNPRSGHWPSRLRGRAFFFAR